MKNLLLLILAFTLPILFVGILLGNRDDNWKEYVIKNKEKIYKNDFGVFKIDSLDGYYTDLSIRITGDSSFYFLAWGDRNSHLWNFRKDCSFEIDIPYRRFKGYDVSNDIEVLKILKNKND